MACPYYDPCTCVGNYTPGTPCPTKTDCFRLGHILVAECDSVGPCGNTGFVPFDCFNIDCDSPDILSFKVYSNSRPDLITVNAINSSGLTFTTSNTAVGNERVEITIYGQCKGECNFKSDYGSVVIYIKNVCKGVLCESYQKCDPCTQVCVNVDPEISIDPGPTEIFIQS